MGIVRLGDLEWSRAIDHPGLMAPSTHAALVAWATAVPEVADLVHVASSDPGLADTAAYVAAYHMPIDASVNCVVTVPLGYIISPFRRVRERGNCKADQHVFIVGEPV